MLENVVLCRVRLLPVEHRDVGRGVQLPIRLPLYLRHLIDHLDEGLLVFNCVGVQTENCLEDGRSLHIDPLNSRKLFDLNFFRFY